MPSAADIQHLAEQYVKALSRHDVDAVAALFASDAVIHDPVDSPAFVGTEKIREFFAQGIDAVRAVKLSGPVHISGDCRHAAANLQAEVNFGDGLKIIEGVDIWTFDDDGRIATMKAYYDPTNLRDA